MSIFNFFGNIFGYLLWALYVIFKNYGVAIILFTIILKAAMFPMSVSQQKSMAKQQKMSEKQKEIQKLYANNKTKYNEELQKLYEKENYNPSSGCLVSLLPMLIMLGIYYSVIFPLQNTLHIATATVTQATDFLSKIPGLASSGRYMELEIIQDWSYLKQNTAFTGIFTGSELDKIDLFSKGFKFCGLNLILTPQNASFNDFLWVIPVLCLLSSWFMTFYTNKSTGIKQQGCMLATMYLMPLLSAYWAFIMPAAVGFYWVISSVIGGVQSIVMSKHFSMQHMAAMNDAQRFVSMQLAEANVKALTATAQKQLSDQINAQQMAQAGKDEKSKKKLQQGKKKSGNKAGKSANDYMGNKK